MTKKSKEELFLEERILTLESEEKAEQAALKTVEQAALKAALKYLKDSMIATLTPDDLKAYKVYPNEKVVLVLDDYRKVMVNWADLGLK